MTEHEEPGLLRIGELSRRVGVSTHVLRAWETRYGLLRPERTAGRFRLYSARDEARVRSMQAHLAAGLSAAEAARAVLAGAVAAPPAAPVADPAVEEWNIAELRRALEDMDEPAAQGVLDRLFAGFTVESVLADVLLPYLRELGERWADGRVSVTQEHFASNLLRGRLTGLARGWGAVRGPRVVLACPPGELHDLALLMFGIVLFRRGWQVCYLGADTPLDALESTLRALRPERAVLAATVPDHFEAVADDLARIADTVPLALAGAGARADLADRVGALALSEDPVTLAAAWARSP